MQVAEPSRQVDNSDVDVDDMAPARCVSRMTIARLAGYWGRAVIGAARRWLGWQSRTYVSSQIDWTSNNWIIGPSVSLSSLSLSNLCA